MLIMTTEILRNFLLDGRTRRHNSTLVDDTGTSAETDGGSGADVADGALGHSGAPYWTMDVAATVSAVVFDEVHYL